MAQEYTVEQLNHGRKVYDFMRWDYWAFGISGLLLIAAIVIMGVRGFNWGGWISPVVRLLKLRSKNRLKLT